MSGIFLLLIIFTREPAQTPWNPWGPFKFSSYDDCRTAGEVIAGFIKVPFSITCYNSESGEIVAEWSGGPGPAKADK